MATWIQIALLILSGIGGVLTGVQTIVQKPATVAAAPCPSVTPTPAAGQ